MLKSVPTGPPGGAGSILGIREPSNFQSHAAILGAQTAYRGVLHGLVRGLVFKSGPTGPPGGAGSQRRSSGGFWPGGECVFLWRRVGGCQPGYGGSCREGEQWGR